VRGLTPTSAASSASFHSLRVVVVLTGLTVRLDGFSVKSSLMTYHCYEATGGM